MHAQGCVKGRKGKTMVGLAEFGGQAGALFLQGFGFWRANESGIF
jgi:hypothetical protein